jgi:hypothetical protein
MCQDTKQQEAPFVRPQAATAAGMRVVVIPSLAKSEYPQPDPQAASGAKRWSLLAPNPERWVHAFSCLTCAGPADIAHRRSPFILRRLLPGAAIAAGLPATGLWAAAVH